MKSEYTPSVIKENLRQFDALFATAIKSNVRLINQISSYIIKKKGKRIRPILVLLSAGSSGGITDSTYRGATLVELLHTATLIHDDVIDNAEIRRGMFSVNAIWKNKISVLMGDYFLSKGLHLSLEHSDIYFLNRITEATKKMSESELLQIDASRRLNIKEETYLTIISGKTAYLFATACQIGAASAFKGDPNPDILSTLWNYGYALGLAFQIRDDILDLVGDSGKTGKKGSSDIKEKKITLPMIHALKTSSAKTRKSILSILKDKDSIEKSQKVLTTFVIDHGGIDYANNLVSHYSNLAKGSLSSLSNKEYTRPLEDLTSRLTYRNT